MLRILFAVLALAAVCTCQFTQLYPSGSPLYDVDPDTGTLATTGSGPMGVAVTTPIDLSAEPYYAVRFQTESNGGRVGIFFRSNDAKQRRLGWVIDTSSSPPTIQLCVLTASQSTQCYQGVDMTSLTGTQMTVRATVNLDGTYLRFACSVTDSSSETGRWDQVFRLPVFPDWSGFMLLMEPVSSSMPQDIKDFVVATRSDVEWVSYATCLRPEEWDELWALLTGTNDAPTDALPDCPILQLTPTLLGGSALGVTADQIFSWETSPDPRITTIDSSKTSGTYYPSDTGAYMGLCFKPIFDSQWTLTATMVIDAGHSCCPLGGLWAGPDTQTAVRDGVMLGHHNDFHYDIGSARDGARTDDCCFGAPPGAHVIRIQRVTTGGVTAQYLDSDNVFKVRGSFAWSAPSITICLAYSGATTARFSNLEFERTTSS